MPRIAPSAPLLIALACLASACVVGRTSRDHPLDEQAIASIERGVTTKHEILEMLGPPQEIDARELVAVSASLDPLVASRRGEKPPVERLVSARWFRYTYARANAFGAILVLFNYAEFDQKNDSLVVFFDGDNRVEDFAYARDTVLLPRFGPFSRW